jgi:hypothetical protein
MNKTFCLTLLVTCFAIAGCGPAINTTVTDGADAAAIEDYKAQIEAQQKEAGAGESSL